MVNRIRTIYLDGLDKRFGSKFCVGSQVQHETLEEGWRMNWPKRCEYNNKDEDNSQNTLNDKNFTISKHFILVVKFLITLFLKIKSIFIFEYFTVLVPSSDNQNFALFYTKWQQKKSQNNCEYKKINT